MKNYKTKHLLLFIFLLIFCGSLHAQSNYKPGYIITNKMDTIHGMIDFRTNKMNSKVCRFKTDISTNETSYSPGEIYGYRFTDDGKYYLSKTITIDKTQQTVFLEYLIQGIIDLYYYPGEQEYYFFKNEIGEMIPITKKPNQIIIAQDNTMQMKEDNQYLGVLNYVFKDSKSVANMATNANFSHKSMIILTKKYHEQMCTSGEECIEFETKEDKKFIQFHFSVYGGVQFNNYSFNSTNVYFEGINPEIKIATLIGFEADLLPEAKSTFPVIGFEAGLYSPRFLKSLSLQLDASLTKMSCDVDYSISDYAYSRFEMESLNFNGKAGARYTIPTGRLKPMIEAGLNYTQLINVSGTCTVESKIYPNLDYDINLHQKTFLGYYGSAGISYQLKNNSAIYLRYVYSNNSLDHEDPLKYSQVLLGYTF